MVNDINEPADSENQDEDDDYLEYKDKTPEQLKVERNEMLTEIEQHRRTSTENTPPDQGNREKGVWDGPLYIDSDALTDPAYHSLSSVAKLTWYALAHAAKTAYHMSKPLDLRFLFVIAGLSTKFGLVLNGEDMNDGLNELIDVGLVAVFGMDDRVPELKKNPQGAVVVTGLRDVDREVLHFIKYISFVKPED